MLCMLYMYVMYVCMYAYLVLDVFVSLSKFIELHEGVNLDDLIFFRLVVQVGAAFEDVRRGLHTTCIHTYT